MVGGTELILSLLLVLLLSSVVVVVVVVVGVLSLIPCCVLIHNMIEGRVVGGAGDDGLAGHRPDLRA